MQNLNTILGQINQSTQPDQVAILAQRHRILNSLSNTQSQLPIPPQRNYLMPMMGQNTQI